MESKTRMRNKKVALLTAGLLAASCFSGCAGTGTEEDNLVIVEQESAPQEYTLTSAVKSDVVLVKKVRCTFSQLDGQEVRFAVSGKRVEKVYVKDGQKVEKGQLLAELSGSNKDDQIERLEYQIERNKLLLEQLEENEAYEISRRWLDYLYKVPQSAEAEQALKDGIEDLKKENGYSREDYEDAISMDEQQLAALRLEKSQSRVYAEFAGMVTRMKDNLEGSTSNREETIMQVMDNSACVFIVDDMSAAASVKPDQELDMQIVAGSGAGKYKMKPYRMEEWEDKMLFTIVDGDDSTGIEAGVSGSLTLILDERQQVLSLPVEAVHAAGKEYYVYVMDGEGNRQVKWVGVGLWGTSNVEITEGLEEGEKVVL